jgi:hypothetical protein
MDHIRSLAYCAEIPLNCAKSFLHPSDRVLIMPKCGEWLIRVTLADCAIARHANPQPLVLNLVNYTAAFYILL